MANSLTRTPQALAARKCPSSWTAVGLFLRGEIGFNDISRRVERALERVPVQYQPGLADILEADKAARRAAL